MATQLGLSDCVNFTGFLAPRDVVARLQPCALCVQPDPKNRFNDACVMIKSLEYMALAKPVVAFDLDETRRVCADAALYASDNCPRNLANEILALADDPVLRHNLGTRGRRRVEEQLAWSFSEPRLLDVYRSLVKSKPVVRQLAV
jgi:glycosyltransferase involved in cell wall biosynthesis